MALGKVYTRFITKTAHKPYSLGRHRTYMVLPSPCTACSWAFSQVAKGSDLYRVDKSTKLCMVVAQGILVNIRIGAHSNLFRICSNCSLKFFNNLHDGWPVPKIAINCFLPFFDENHIKREVNGKRNCINTIIIETND